MEADIFDLSDLSDLPQNLRADLRATSRDPFEKNVIEVFKRAGRELEIDEVMVGYFRIYKEVKERKQIISKLYNMSRSEYPAIQSIEGKKGVYKLILKDGDP